MMTLMQAELLDLLCAPGSLALLRLEGDVLIEEDGRHRYPVREGIPCLVGDHLQIQTRGWQTFYDRAAFAYDGTLRLAQWLRLSNEEPIRTEFLGALDISPETLILDIGCGSGSSRAAFPSHATYLGIDLSLNMLRRAQAKCASHGWPAYFVQGEAEALPVRSQRVDVILSMGVLQHLKYPSKALREMRRVAKQNARILLIDEKRSLNALQRKLGWTGESGNATQGLAGFSEWCKADMNLDPVEQRIFGEYFILDLYNPN
jgi:ubiquinone/menaquinone biosynthesis C-methylase UbiE